MTAAKKVTSAEKSKRKNAVTMIEQKRERITKWESGTRVSQLAVFYEKAMSTIIIKKKTQDCH